MIWCNNCREYYPQDGFKTLKIERDKTGRYYPYRDSMDSESYTFTEITLQCKICDHKTKVEDGKHYHESESDMQKYGYRGSNYGT